MPYKKLMAGRLETSNQDLHNLKITIPMFMHLTLFCMTDVQARQYYNVS